MDKLSPTSPSYTRTPVPGNGEPLADCSQRPVGNGWGALPQRALVALVQGYRYLLKPWLGNACRFEPTCSQYALDALRRHGAGVGTGLITGRLLRCHPWCQGGCDPVPQQAPKIFSRLGLGQVRPQHDSNDKEPLS